MRIYEVFVLGLIFSKLWFSYLFFLISRFVKFYYVIVGRRFILGIFLVIYFLWACFFKIIFNINGSFFSFDFVSYFWCRMLDGSLFLCLCIFVYFGGMVKL